MQHVVCSQEVKDFHGCNLLVLCKQIQVSLALFLSTNIHQGDNLFSVQSRGKQCAFMSLSAVLTAQNIPLIETLDNVLLQGDKMYLHALDNGFFDLESGVELLSADNLPNVVSISSCTSMFSLICYEVCGSMIDTSNINVPVTTAVLEPIEAQNQNDLPNVVEPFEAQNNIQLPIVVEPIEAQNKYDLPIVVEPIKAQNKYDLPIVVEPGEAQNKNYLPIVVEPIEAQNNIQLPIVIEPIEAQNKRIEHNSVPDETKNENQIWLINYEKELQGVVIITNQEIELHYYDIHTALLNVFLNNSYQYSILILEGYMMALIKQSNFFYLFDLHA